MIQLRVIAGLQSYTYICILKRSRAADSLLQPTGRADDASLRGLQNGFLWAQGCVGVCDDVLYPAGEGKESARGGRRRGRRDGDDHREGEDGDGKVDHDGVGYLLTGRRR